MMRTRIHTHTTPAVPVVRARASSARVVHASIARVTSPLVTPLRARLSAPTRAIADVDPMSSYDGTSCVLTGPEVDRRSVGEELRAQIKAMGGAQIMDARDFVSTPAQRAQCVALFGSCAALALKGLVFASVDDAGFNDVDAMAMAITIGLAYWTSDLGTGIFHWSVDNYGSKDTPLLGGVIDAFQGHHKYPWTITKRQFANNIHKTCLAPLVFTVPTLLFNDKPTDLVFVGVFTSLVVLSQQFHAWSHTKKSELPEIVMKAQDLGVFVSRRDHGQHHKSPFEGHYCIVSGYWNPILDNSGFFRKLEKVIYNQTGIAPRCWSDDVDFFVQEDAPEGFGDGVL
uniref:Lipid desaturase domain-containing protein n=1 Tax=Ostreococcus mediterraneus TaxID=1486918 RepID=A0A7S0KQA8_9CHLO